MNIEIFKNKKVIIAIVVVAVLGLVWRGVSGFIAQRASESLVEKALENATGGKADFNIKGDGENFEYSIKTDDGEVTVKAGQKIPDNFPSKLKQYPDFEITTTATTSENNGGQVYATTPDSSDKVMAFYKKNFEDNGWEITATYTMGETSMMTASGDGFDVVVTYAVNESESSKNTLMISYSQKEE